MVARHSSHLHRVAVAQPNIFKPMAQLTFACVRQDKRWATQAILKRVAQRIMPVLPDQQTGHITFVFTNDAHIQTLNATYRHKDKPTNVLSFPDGSDDENGVLHYGDVVLAYETIAREALEEDKDFNDHLIHLMVHGALHLFGFDHETEADAHTMESMEIQILAQLGIKNPYQDKTS